MVEHSDDCLRLVKHRQFIDKVKGGIQNANREIVNAYIQTMDRDMFLAVAVGQLRAHYLESSLKLFLDYGDNWPADGAISGLRQERERYEEYLYALDALHRAIERGYVDLTDYGPTEDGSPGPCRALRETRP